MGTSEFRRVYSAGPSITKLEIDYATDAVTNGWFDNRNSYLDRFTESFSEYVKSDYVLPTAHCTDAIHLALLALNIGPGDEVIVPDLTWVASGAPILYVGATPVFADVSKETWCISVEDIEKNFTPKTKAVVVVDLLGNMPDWDPILSFCRAKGIAIIEDAAESVGAKYKGRVAGSFGDISLFSFNATKLMMAGQGGAFCTNNKELYTSAKRKSHHGIDTIASGKYFWSNELGYNYNWTNVQAAVALAQLERIEQLLAHKRWVFETYSSLLRDQDSITLNQRTNETFEPSYWVPSIIFDEKFNFSKEEIMEQGAKVGIDFRPMFYPLSSMPTFSAQLHENRTMAEQNPTSYYLSRNGLSLPSGNELVEEDLIHVSEYIRATIRNLER
jgi:perosamine synthetase